LFVASAAAERAALAHRLPAAPTIQRQAQHRARLGSTLQGGFNAGLQWRR